MLDLGSWSLVAALVFLFFLLFKLRVSVSDRRSPDHAEAKARLADARKRAKAAKGEPKVQARALQEAALVALSELRQPRLASGLARRAERLDPSTPVGPLVRVLSAAGRYPALERLLWRRVDLAGDDLEVASGALDALVALYEGPMKREHQARALRRLRGSAAA
jgi:hypothetical protein